MSAAPTQLADTREDESDPPQKFLRMIHMHRWDTTSLDWMLAPRVN